MSHHHLPPPPVVTPPPPPPPVVEPPAPTTVVDTAFPDIANEFQTGVSDLLTGNTGASAVLQQAAFDLHAAGAITYPGDSSVLSMVGDINMLAQDLNTNPALTNNLLYDVGQQASAFASSSLGTGNFTVASTAPSPVQMEDNATEWNTVSTLDRGVLATEQNLTNIANGNLAHLTYTETQIQDVLTYYTTQVKTDPTFVGANAADFAHIVQAETTGLHAITDILAHGGTTVSANDQNDIGAAASVLGLAGPHLIGHNLPPPDHWLIA